MRWSSSYIERYAAYKKTTGDKALPAGDSAGATDYIFPMHERYHAEAIENAFEDINRLSKAKPASAGVQ